MNAQELQVRAIERTKDPLAPIKLAEAHKWATYVGKMLAVGGGNAEQTKKYTDMLLKTFPDGVELDKMCGDPSFIVALCSMLVTSLEAYGRDA